MKKGSKKPRKCARCLSKIGRTKRTNICRACEGARHERLAQRRSSKHNHIMATFARDNPSEIPPIMDMRMVSETKYRRAATVEWDGKSVRFWLLNIQPYWASCWGKPNILVWGDRLNEPVYGRPHCQHTEYLAYKHRQAREDKETSIKNDLREAQWKETQRKRIIESSKEIVVAATGDKSSRQFFTALTMAGASKQIAS